ncbi:DNA polymerase III subunit alpha [Apilactobacillus timberlakei]|uniref:DNA polymerase III subunit alpha n=1 Tax=Apilactobacillus timberlakei TaxID=2008380 RepID=UPI00112D1012|nr:DNA polymerase III subunit alpha [Apilactobacillus timberlakei]TPR20077.1 DNA polymerase III subunit alpha [Apilactobacillus timberlakei]TPR21795.1 DNA polymerase III subunit alpha [Apilactobacillus timberlakei]TPR23041.1 DNA polymerase III subunit alpha [Apilactobacillus timberlakei]TPR23979.1 DNA polymerase III subunit alpha [Apilactobacillus timberlakei]
MNYVPLNVISSYSLLDSTISIDNLISAAKQRGYNALALTDENVMYGAIEFYNKCIKNNIHPIIGLTIELNGLNDDKFKLVLIAKNNNGYQNLMKISTKKMTNESEKISLSDIKPFLNDLFIIIPNYGNIASWIKQDNLEKISNILNEVIGYNNNLYFGISDKDLNNGYYDSIIKLKLDIKLVAFSKVQNIDKDDSFALKVLRYVDNGEKFSNPLEESNLKDNNWLKPKSDFINNFVSSGHQDIVQNNETIIYETNVKIDKKQPQLPKFKNDYGLSSKEYLKQLCKKGLLARFNELNILKDNQKQYYERLKYELSVIDRMNFDDYFLIVWDVINYAHKANIMTGPGRGSAAGSLVAYCLYITDVDPISYDLLFERFLNEERAQMPDIDLDIPDDKREKVLDYVHNKYGDDHVAQIVTFGTMAAKQVLRDVGRTFGLSPYQMSDWSNAIPSNQLHITLGAAYDQSQKLKNLVSDNHLNRLLFDTAKKLEGLPRHYSTHAAGLILSKDKLVKTSPLQNGSEGIFMTQYSKNYVEEIGLLKIDFLGLRNLSLLADIFNHVKSEANNKFSIRKINLDDSKTLSLFKMGDTNGIFQFESAGIKRVLKALQPDNFNLVAAVDALYRPGPMGNIESFIKRKNGQENVTYADDTLKPILGPTFGIIVYQEQVMRVASTMGGFTLGEADLLRRAMSKKKHDVMDSMKSKFINGALEKGYSEISAKQTFDYIDQFASYGFNKSHAVAYSKMAFELAYLKAHYSMQFFVSILNSVLNNNKKTKIYLTELKKRNIKVDGPNINISDKEFKINNNNILFGLGSIKGLRSDFINDLIDERNTNGLFNNLEQFLQRIDSKYRKIDLINALVYSGAMDDFGYNRSELLASIPEFIDSINLSGNSMELFDALKPKIKHLDEMPLNEKLQKENEYLGAYLSGHPVEQYINIFNSINIVSSDSVLEYKGEIYTVLYLDSIKQIRTKNGKEMAFAHGTDLSGGLSITIFPNVFTIIKDWFKNGIVVLIKGKVEQRDGAQIIANKIYPAANVKSDLIKNNRGTSNKKWYLKIDSDHDSPKNINILYQEIKNNYGNNRVIIYREKNKKTTLLNHNYDLNYNSNLFSKLIHILGNGNVVYK